MTRLDDFIAIITADSAVAAEKRLKAAGFTNAETADLCAQPGADKAILRASYQRHVLPRLPDLIQRLTDTAVGEGGGAAAARSAILALLSPTGPLSADLSDLGAMTDQGLREHAKALTERLRPFLDEPCSNSSTTSLPRSTDDGENGL